MQSSIKLGLMFTTALAMAPVVAAQDITEVEYRQDTILVQASPIRDSLAAAMEAKQNADNVVDVLAADTIGRFPDQNLADSLARVPGLAVERDQGQARYVNFRGAPFRYTKIAFDGIDVLGAEDGRTPRFDAFPSVITSRIEVNKAITADMPAESTVGFVNIETFKPFDREGFSATGELGYGKQQLGDVDIEKFNGRMSYSNDQFGALLFGSHNLRGRITDNREYGYTDSDGNGVDDSIASLDFRSYRGEREDNAYGGRIEFRLTPQSSIFVSSLYSEFIDLEERNQFVFEVMDPTSPTAPTPSSVPMDAETFAPFVSTSRVLEYGTYDNSTLSNTLGYDGQFDDWYVEARLNHTETENNTFLPIPRSVYGFIGANIDVTDIYNPIVDPTQPFAPGTETDVNTLSYAATVGILVAGKTDTEATKLKLDVERDFEFGGLPTRVKFGGLYDTREASGGSAQQVGGFPGDVDIADFVTDKLWSADFNNSIGGRDFDNVGLREAWANAVGGLDVPFAEDSLIGIEEDIWAFYAMATTEFGWGNLVYGLRVEQTDFTSTGTMIDPISGDVLSIEASNDYTNVLPSVHANFDLRDDLKLRLSASSGISRPTYNEARASQSVDTTETPYEISGGNPYLDPEESFGFDAALEWYFAPASLLSVGAYYRQIDNVIYPGSETVDGSLYAPDIIEPGTDTTYFSSFNGDDGELSGFEINAIYSAADFLPAPFDGLGASGNITFIDSSFYAPNLGASYSLPGTSDTVYNASLFYEKFGLSARVNYQYRDAWLSTTENDSLSEFWDEAERVDASVRYTIPNDFYGTTVTLALNGNNLTDERDTRYINSPMTPNQYEGFGRRWVASIRIDY